MLNTMHLKIIKCHLIEDHLTSFHNAFNLICTDLGIPISINRVQ